jgi:hypothetical protein
MDSLPETPKPSPPPGKERPIGYRTTINRLLWILVPVLVLALLAFVIFRLPWLFPVAPAFPPLATYSLKQPTQEDLLPGRVPIEFSDTAGVGAFPLEAVIYRTQGPVEITDVENLCNKLGVFPSIRMTPQAFLAGKNEELLVWRSSGSFLLSISLQAGPHRSLSSDDALQASQSYLQEHGLWPSEKMTDRITLLDPNQQQITVQFNRWLGEVPVAESIIEVSFQGDQVVSLYSNCRPLQAQQSYPILKYDQIQQFLLAEGPKDLVVQGMRLAYQEAIPQEVQHFLLPVIAVWGKLSDSGQPYLTKIWALDSSYLSP